MEIKTSSRDYVVGLSRNMQVGADGEKRRAEAAALNVLLGIDKDNSLWIAAEAYGMHRAYQHCTKELDSMRMAIERKEVV